MAALPWSLKICFLYVSLTSLIGIDAKTTLCPRQVFRNGHTLISDNNRFELGFFNVSPTRDANRDLQYLGIWYRQIKPLSVVWVANRGKPLRGLNVKFVMNKHGDLLLHDDEGNMISLARLNQPVSRPLLVLLDSGNLVIKDGNKNDSNERYVWQSFDFPSDTLLPGMKFGWDIKSGLNRVLTSWKTSEDPWYGDFLFSLESDNSPQLLLEKNGVTQSRWGPWNGKRFSGINIKKNKVFTTVYQFSPEEVYFTFEMLDDSILVRLVVNSVGAIQFLKWKHSSNNWIPLVTLNNDVCDRYGSCGPYGICDAHDSGCKCLKGFLANSPHDWGRLDCTDGCMRKNALNCSDGDSFVKYSGVKLPDKFTVWRGLSYRKCGDYCLKECACIAYTVINIYGNGNECVIWLDKLVDIRESAHDGDELYVRMARAELLESISHKRKKNITAIIHIILLTVFVVIALWCAKIRFISPYMNTNKEEDGLQNRESIRVLDDDNQYVHLFDISIIYAATNNFSLANKIGEGGFGRVYKGELQDGQKIAVKRLSENSSQGFQEFKNEANSVAQLQHRNLAKLLGCCIHGEERMLVYEYMPNKSLDQFIFEPARKRLLPWEKRISILKGIAKGLDYLHSGSRLRLIHRDLKASNILLDEEMNPKISDFGLAKNFDNDGGETTKRVIGTYGYMSPEYVMIGQYSTKSDIFSFGVLAIEIISGKRNWGFHHPDHEFNLLGHAWKLWTEGRNLALIDPVLKESFVGTEVTRCIQVGLLCAQHSSEKRPTMSQVVFMLENENDRLPEPQEPGFFSGKTGRGIDSSLGWNQDSVNWLTITALTGRE